MFVIYAGIFTRSIIFRILNTLIHPSMFLSSGGINTPDTRFFWLQISDTIFSVCSSVFFIGCVFILYFFIKNAPFISFHLMLSHFFKSVIPMFGIAGLFAITDFDFRFDYLFPLWPILIQMALLFLIALIADFIKSRWQYIQQNRFMTPVEQDFFPYFTQPMPETYPQPRLWYRHIHPEPHPFHHHSVSDKKSHDSYPIHSIPLSYTHIHLVLCNIIVRPESDYHHREHHSPYPQYHIHYEVIYGSQPFFSV